MNESDTNTYIINCRLESYILLLFSENLVDKIKGILFFNKNQEKSLFYELCIDTVTRYFVIYFHSW